MSSTPYTFTARNMSEDDPFKELPFLRTSSTVNPQPPLSFSTIIDQDHSQINAVSLQLGKLLSPKRTQTPQLRKQQLETLRIVTWRLIRHDVSEDIIMRPAFAQYLGAEGKAMGEHDRQDHDNAKRELLELYVDFERVDLGDTDGFKRLRRRYVELMTGLTEHMKTESGTDIPRLESVLGREESLDLGRRYLRTQVLGPALRIGEVRVWRNVGEYVSESAEGFWKVWRRVQAEETAKRKESKL